MMKRSLLLCTLALTLLLGGCGAQQSSRLEYIGADAAKALALSAAGFSADQAAISGVDMSTQGGLDYYNVEFTAQGQTYRYNIDALTGTVIESQVPPAEETASGADANQADDQLPSQAPQGNLTAAYGPAAQQSPAQSSQEPSSSDGSTLTVDEAKSIALAHAGLSADQVTFVKSGLDWDDGKQTFDLEFYTGDYREYDYDIDPNTGEVLSFDHDAEYYTPPASASSDSGSITADETKAKALAQVPGATLDNIWEFETDYDDGRLEYEGKIYYDNLEYEFEIDGYSGAIRSWEVESIYD